MTLPKRPLPSLRFLLLDGRGKKLLELIPKTTPKGRVVEGQWAVPGGAIRSTYQLTELCRRRRWLWRIVGDDGSRRQT